MSEAQEKPPIVHLSDGPRFILANGDVVRLLVSSPEGGDLPFITTKQGSSLFGTGDAESSPVSIAAVDDPEAEEHEEVRERLETYGFKPKGYK